MSREIKVMKRKSTSAGCLLGIITALLFAILIFAETDYDVKMEQNHNDVPSDVTSVASKRIIEVANEIPLYSKVIVNSFESNITVAEHVKHMNSKYLEAKKIQRERELQESSEKLLADISEITEVIDDNVEILSLPKLDRSKKIYDIPLEASTQWYIYDMCMKYGVMYDVAIATVYAESGFNANCVHKNKNGSIDKGLFQINECNWDNLRKKFGSFDPLDLYQNIEAGILFISQAMEYHDDPTRFMMVYNQGAGGARKSWKKGTYSTSYTRKIKGYATETLPDLMLQDAIVILHYK